MQKKQKSLIVKYDKQSNLAINSKNNTYKESECQKSKNIYATMAKTQHSKTIVKSNVNSMSLKGMSSAKSIWKK